MVCQVAWLPEGALTAIRDVGGERLGKIEGEWDAYLREAGFPERRARCSCSWKSIIGHREGREVSSISL